MTAATGADAPSSSTSVIVSTAGAGALVREIPRTFVVEAVRSVRRDAGVRDVEIVVVHDESTPPAALAALAEVPDVDLVLVPFPDVARRASALNHGALHASGRALVFLHERTESAAPASVHRLAAALDGPGAGLAGPKVLQLDDTIWDAGSVLQRGRLVHPWRGAPDVPETSPDLFLDRTVDVLDPSCIAMTTDVFHDIGGWSEEVPGDLAHVDLSLKVGRAGLEVRWCHAARITSFAPPPERPAQWKVDFLRRRWGRILAGRTV